MEIITLRSCVRDSYKPDFTFYMDYFLFLSSLCTFIAFKNVNLEYVCINSQLAQSEQPGANNAYFMSSTLKRTRFHFLCRLFSLFE